MRLLHLPFCFPRQHADHFTKRYIRGDLDDVDYSKGVVYKKSPMKLSELDVRDTKQQVVLLEGAPGVGKTTFSWEFSKKWSRGEILQDHSLLKVVLPTPGAPSSRTTCCLVSHTSSSEHLNLNTASCAHRYAIPQKLHYQFAFV